MFIKEKMLAVLLVLCCAIGLAAPASASPPPDNASAGYVPPAGWKRTAKNEFQNQAKSLKAVLTAYDAHATPEESARALQQKAFGTSKNVETDYDGQYAYFAIRVGSPEGLITKTVVLIQNYGCNPERQLKMVLTWPDTVVDTHTADGNDLFNTIVADLTKRPDCVLKSSFMSGNYETRKFDNKDTGVTLLKIPDLNATVSYLQKAWHGPLTGAAEEQRRLALADGNVTCTPVELSADGTTASFYVTGIEGRTGWAFKSVPMPDPKQRAGMILVFRGSWPASYNEDATANFVAIVQSAKAAFR